MGANNLVRWCLALAVGLTTVWLASTLSAKPNSADRPASVAVAYLNVNAIFDKYPPFADAMKVMKEDVTGAEEDVKKRRDAIKKMTELCDADKSKSEEKIRVEVEIAQASSKLQTDISLQRAAFVRREAQIYADVYEKIVAETAAYAKENRILSVTQISNQTPPDSSNAEAVLKYINRLVVWHDEQSDITPAILKRLIDKASQEDAKQKPKEAKSADSDK